MNAAEKLAIKSQIKSLKEATANLESLLKSETPVKDIKKKKEFVVLDSMTAEEITELAQALAAKADFNEKEIAAAVAIKASYVTKLYEGHEVPYLDRNKIALTLVDSADNDLVSTEVNKKVLKDYYPQLAYMGVLKNNPDHTATVVTMPL